MRTLPLLVLALAVALFAPAAAQAKKAPTKYHLALGDSLAWGYEQDATGAIVRSPKGYVNQVYSAARKRTKRLKLVNYGCPGETLTTFTDGGCIGQPLVSLNDTRPQWTKAAAFLKKHRKRVSLITISIGANEFTFCAKGDSVDIACIGAGLERLKAILPVVAKKLRKAAGRKVRIVTHDLYNPYLALALRGGEYATLAYASVAIQQQVNQIIRTSVAPAKLKVAPVAAAFGSDVETVCALTQACLPKPQGNIHPNDAGYTAIAKAFRKTLKL
jgi:lysophospholipase L1-like esterase